LAAKKNSRKPRVRWNVWFPAFGERRMFASHIREQCGLVGAVQQVLPPPEPHCHEANAHEEQDGGLGHREPKILTTYRRRCQNVSPHGIRIAHDIGEVSLRESSDSNAIYYWIIIEIVETVTTSWFLRAQRARTRSYLPAASTLGNLLGCNAMPPSRRLITMLCFHATSSRRG